ncbi:MAG: RdgB/HAM1 family non-canonical purine NTP pyrophosphatase [Spirochaetales bacterium]|nr:RdgB/HAM1 family non-canonical purine NTP pyrophosphatase [Candidatus Physcosoma equi]
MKLYFASGNLHKKLETSRLLGGYELTLPKEEGYTFDPEENRTTFVENAIIKAKALYDIVKEPVISDDSGLCVRALDWKPGIYTARYGCENGKELNSVEKYMLLLKNMEGEKDRYAEFVCAICLYINPNRIYVIQESSAGEIALAPSNGTEGFGYDPIFFNYEAGKIVADLSEGEKDIYSHRGKAARVMKTLLDKEINR